jgi:hypothetical protein
MGVLLLRMPTYGQLVEGTRRISVLLASGMASSTLVCRPIGSPSLVASPSAYSDEVRSGRPSP